MAENFDERSGVIYSNTPWGRWAQTIEDVFIEIDVPCGTRGKNIQCDIKINNLTCVVRDKEIIKGKLFGRVIPDESVWTLEDQTLIRIVLVKSEQNPAKGWKSLLVDQYQVDPFTFNEMEKKLTLERFQKENPGFDFSGADVSGNYSKGGPSIPGTS
ncbi:nudC domain-containing protein 2 [Exaiptasia diaphana]|uniref:CS domain-containing protein n=1 Tax=Exaiptasia diaphana TaxID=2652724 RepID=A0A913X7V1_EXADI|nr:nudC domain-containing protein 2 [Exaiptasia diaphana]KXJ14356.1 NudC domain-containing protein 2 [Exaiptasia diaphana]